MAMPTETTVRDFLDSMIDHEEDDPTMNAVLVIVHTSRILLEAGLLDGHFVAADTDPALDIPSIHMEDPYGSAIKSALMAVRVGLTLEGSMSSAEHANLIAIEELIRQRDNA